MSTGPTRNASIFSLFFVFKKTLNVPIITSALKNVPVQILVEQVKTFFQAESIDEQEILVVWV
jgi:hypothetical protein